MCLFIETIRVENGTVYNLDYHTERLNRTRAAFWKDCAPLDLREFVSLDSLQSSQQSLQSPQSSQSPQFLRASQSPRALNPLHPFQSPQSLAGIYKCRVLYGREIEEITYAPYQMREISSLRLIAADTVDYTYKSANRDELNALYARRGMADDVLIVKDGYLTDTSIANVALYDEKMKIWCTPSHPLLRGTKRAELIDKRIIVEREIPQAHLGEYSKIMLFNAMIDWGRIVLPIDAGHMIL